MASPLSNAPQVEEAPKHACTVCARRKVKCDKRTPCSNCVKSQAQCLYEAPAPPRPRKRHADEDLVARLALYEELMRKHHVDFTSYAQTWVPAEVGGKLDDRRFAALRQSSLSSGGLDVKHSPSEEPTPQPERVLWANLSPELKYPPVHWLCHKDDPILVPTPSLQSILLDPHPSIHELHPHPKHIYRLWQVFVEKVNPLTKIIHVPTLQQRVLDASWDLSNVPKSLNTLLFAIYTLSVTSLTSEECQDCFGETRAVLITRYRTASLRAFVAADFLTTRDLEVLQALVLFLMADPESDLTSTLTSSAMIIGQKMGLDRENTDAGVSFFEKEMRIRLWWQLFGLNTRIRALSVMRAKPHVADFGNVRLPLNISDADLHPTMTEAPVEHQGPTEMMCVLVKFEVFNWLRSSPKAALVFENIFHGPMQGRSSLIIEDGAIDELEAHYKAKYFQVSDPRIPLHNLTYILATLAVCRMRFRVHHPRGRSLTSGGKEYATKAESDALFEAALTTVEMVDKGMSSKFSSQLFTHMTTKAQMDAYIYIICELQRRCSGDRVALAWRLVEAMFKENPEVIDDTENSFYVALGDLVLVAWEARKGELIREQQFMELDVTPQFVRQLWLKRHDEQDDIVPLAPELGPFGSETLVSDGSDLYGDFWSSFLQF
ncbi:hypothetical protein G7046_g384 [Stylonectria norvegica]|nr:hypothetical protein G7046_g384 [Stylonectria norvegica]